MFSSQCSPSKSLTVKVPSSTPSRQWTFTSMQSGVDPADAAEVVLGGVCAERVRRDRLGTAQELEVRFGHDEMQEAFLGADRAVAAHGFAL